MVARPWPGGEKRIGGQTPHHETFEALGAFRYCPSFSLMDFIRQDKQGLDLGQLIRELSWYPIG